MKSRGQSLQFNDSLRTSVGTIETVLRWAGLFQPQEIAAIAVELRKALTPTDPPAQAIPTINGPRNTRVRAILCSPERQSRARNQVPFIDGSELFTYMRQCFCPQRLRAECATTYDFTSWGSRFDPIVRFIKQRGPEATSTINDLYRHLGL